MLGISTLFTFLFNIWCESWGKSLCNCMGSVNEGVGGVGGSCRRESQGPRSAPHVLYHLVTPLHTCPCKSVGEIFSENSALCYHNRLQGSAGCFQSQWGVKTSPGQLETDSPRLSASKRSGENASILPQFLPGSLGTVMSFIKMGSWRRALLWKRGEWTITVYVNYCLAEAEWGCRENGRDIIISTFSWARTVCQVCATQSAYAIVGSPSPRGPLWPVFHEEKWDLEKWLRPHNLSASDS